MESKQVTWLKEVCPYCGKELQYKEITWEVYHHGPAKDMHYTTTEQKIEPSKCTCEAGILKEKIQSLILKRACYNCRSFRFDSKTGKQVCINKLNFPKPVSSTTDSPFKVVETAELVIVNRHANCTYYVSSNLAVNLMVDYKK